jgi:TonB family protein
VDIAAIDNGDIYAFVPVVEDVPMEVEKEQKKNKDEGGGGGGGGGGGRDEETPTSQGRLANQMEKPLLNPDKSFVQKDNFELHQTAATQGNRQFQQTDQPYGDPNSKYYLSSNGQGTGGGQGSGQGQGQGSGRGTGTGSGDGSGSGSGDGDGNGDGNGPGGSRTGPPPPPVVAGVTQTVKIISKPRASYTDAARQNNIQGSVSLRITFLASGQIGGISPVSGLPYGLTEQAIAAARSIRFEPAKRNGVPYTKQMTVVYGFTIY